MPKHGKKEPKPQLTPEEKKALAEQKKLEAQLEKERLIKQQKFDYLARELQYGQLTIKRHEKDWRKMLMKIALPRMREDLEFAWHNFERVIDAKDFEISILMDELSDAREQYNMNFRNHCKKIDMYIRRFSDRLDDLKDDYDEQLNDLKTRMDAEAAELAATTEDDENYLKMMLFGLDQDMKAFVTFVRSTYLSKIDEENRSYKDVLQTLRADLEQKLVSIWTQCQNFLKKHDKEFVQKFKAYNALAEQDKLIQKQVQENIERININAKTITRLRNAFTETQRVRTDKINDLLSERQYLTDCFTTLKDHLKGDKYIDTKNITLVTVLSNDVMDHLGKIVTKGERILLLGGVCRKFETLEEKILPFPLSSPAVSEDSTEEEPLTLGNDEFKTVQELEQFWQRVAQADAVRYGLNEEIEFLKEQSEILKTQLHKHCQCVSCFFSADSKPTGDDESEREFKLPLAVIDGNLEMRKYKGYEFPPEF